MNISNICLGNFAKRNGIVFTTGYFQTLTGQSIKDIPKQTVSREEMILICKGKSKYNADRNTLFIARDKRGNLVKTCYIDERGERIESALFYP